MESILSIRDVRVVFDDDFVALNGVSIDIGKIKGGDLFPQGNVCQSR